MQFSLEVQICIRIPFLHTVVLFGNKEYIPWFQLSRDSNFCFKVSYCIFLHPKWSTAFYKHPLQFLRPRLLFMVNAKWVFSMNYYCRNIFEYVWYEVQNITKFFLSPDWICPRWTYITYNWQRACSTGSLYCGCNLLSLFFTSSVEIVKSLYICRIYSSSENIYAASDEMSLLYFTL